MDIIPPMTCDWCGKSFPADARACLEAGVDLVLEEGDFLPPFIPQADREAIQSAIGIDAGQMDTLITGGSLEGIGTIVCLQCQDAAAADDPP